MRRGLSCPADPNPRAVPAEVEVQGAGALGAPHPQAAYAPASLPLGLGGRLWLEDEEC